MSCQMDHKSNKDLYWPFKEDKEWQEEALRTALAMAIRPMAAAYAHAHCISNELQTHSGRVSIFVDNDAA